LIPPIPRLAITSGEPAGIGPDLCLQLAHDINAECVLIGDRHLLKARANQLGLEVELTDYDPKLAPEAGKVSLLHVPMQAVCKSGQLDSRNAKYVLALLEYGTNGCLQNEFAALITAPVHKAIINEAGIAFTGHTEYLAQLCGSQQPVMLLATEGLRVALATTHLPLTQVSENISRESLSRVLNVLHTDLQQRFGIESPHILVCGLNPHAGEDGHLGQEEINTIEPALSALREQGLNLTGPLPADTAFTPPKLAQADAVLAMYHDQGLPVLKHLGFGRAVNVTLGLPIIRTSVDHGTALELAGTGKADNGSLHTAIGMALSMVNADG